MAWDPAGQAAPEACGPRCEAEATDRREKLRPRRASRLRNVYDPVRPLFRIRRGPDEHKFVNHFSNRRELAHNENARTGFPAHQELAEVPRHGLAVVRD